jgi:hypothetical protein
MCSPRPAPRAKPQAPHTPFNYMRHTVDPLEATAPCAKMRRKIRSRSFAKQIAASALICARFEIAKHDRLALAA